MRRILRRGKPWFILGLLSSWAFALLAAGSEPLGGPVAEKSAEPASIAAQRESVNRQRQSVNRQVSATALQSGAQTVPGAGKFMAPLAEPVVFEPAAFSCGAVRKNVLESLISNAAQKNELTPAVLRAVIRQESGFNPCAVSYRGAQGLMQLMPETAYELGVADPFDPKQNIDAGASYLKQLLDHYGGDLKLALGAYNAGALRVDLEGGVPELSETQNYVESVCTALEAGESAGQGLRCEPRPQPGSRIK